MQFLLNWISVGILEAYGAGHPSAEAGSLSFVKQNCRNITCAGLDPVKAYISLLVMLMFELSIKPTVLNTSCYSLPQVCE